MDQPKESLESTVYAWFDIMSRLCDNPYMNIHERRIELFVAANGKAPFEEWMRTLRDKGNKARIFSRIDRLRLGNFGDCKAVGEGVFELRIHVGPGFRLYFGMVGAEVVLLLCGGDKSSQPRDIANAIHYWKEYQSHANEEL